MEQSLRPRIQDGVLSAARIAASFFRSDHADFELHLSMPRPGSPQIAAVGQGEAEFALVIEEPAVMMLFRFGDAIPWTVAHHDRSAERGNRGRFHATEAGSLLERPAHMDVFLTDSVSRAVRATRSVDLWLDFTRRLDAAIREQSRIVFDPSDWRRAVSRLERRFPELEMLARHAQVRSPEYA